MKVITFKRLRALQMAMVVTTGILALGSGMAVSTVHRLFEWRCPLFAKVSIALDAPNKTVQVTDAVWGSTEICHFATFEGVAVFMTSLICLLFLLQVHEMFSDYSDSTVNTNAAFMLPMIVLDSFLAVCTIVASSYISEGLRILCDGLEQSPGIASKGYSCDDLQKNTWVLQITHLKPRHKFKFFSYLTLASATSWLTSLALLGQIAVTFLLAYLHTLESMDTVQPAPRLPGPREGTTQFSISMTGESVDSADQSVHTAPSSTTAFRRWKAATPATAVATAVGVQKKRQTVLDSLCVIKDYHDMVRRESYVDTG
ncbi:hypothetical protein BaRGS_00016460, partial [Batillaria attramentaria]